MEIVKNLTPQEQRDKEKIDNFLKKLDSFVKQVESATPRDREAFFAHLEELEQEAYNQEMQAALENVLSKLSEEDLKILSEMLQNKK